MPIYDGLHKVSIRQRCPAPRRMSESEFPVSGALATKKSLLCPKPRGKGILETDFQPLRDFSWGATALGMCESQRRSPAVLTTLSPAPTVGSAPATHVCFISGTWQVSKKRAAAVGSRSPSPSASGSALDTRAPHWARPVLVFKEIKTQQPTQCPCFGIQVELFLNLSSRQKIEIRRHQRTWSCWVKTRASYPAPRDAGVPLALCIWEDLGIEQTTNFSHLIPSYKSSPSGFSLQEYSLFTSRDMVQVTSCPLRFQGRSTD